MSYVLMSRSQIVANMWDAGKEPDPRERWAAWLREEDGKRWVGHMVGRRLAERLRAAAAGQQVAEQERDRLSGVTELIASWLRR